MSPEPARADDRRITDPADSPGRLDVKVAKHGHTETGKLSHTIRMWDPWRNRALRNHRASIILYLYGPRGSGIYCNIYIRYTGGELVAEIRHFDDDPDDACIAGRVRVRRPNAYSVRVIFPKRRIQRGIDAYRWAVKTYWSVDAPRVDDDLCWNPAPHGGGCEDHAPQSGFVRHVI